VISQEELVKFNGYKVKIKNKASKLKLAEAAIKDMEASFVKRIEGGEEVEKGDFVARIKETVGRVSISWKDIVTKLKGLSYVENIIQKTKRPVVKKLEVVRERWDAEG